LDLLELLARLLQLLGQALLFVLFETGRLLGLGQLLLGGLQFLLGLLELLLSLGQFCGKSGETLIGIRGPNVRGGRADDTCEVEGRSDSQRQGQTQKSSTQPGPEAAGSG
jgi:hypothetical protein